MAEKLRHYWAVTTSSVFPLIIIEIFIRTFRYILFSKNFHLVQVS